MSAVALDPKFGDGSALAGAIRQLPKASFAEPASSPHVGSVPVHDEHSCRGQGNMSLNNDARHCRVQSRSNLPATLEDFNEAVAQAMRSDVANDRAPAKRIAIVADRSHRAAEKWLAGVHAPHPFHLFKLAAELPALKALLRKFLEFEATVDPRTERALLELTQALAEQIGRGER